MRITLNYEGKVITVEAIGNIDFIRGKNGTCIYFIDNGLGEEWEIPVEDVIDIQ